MYALLPIQTLCFSHATQATGDYHNFTNIRYGRAPVGKLRFASPQPPLMNRSVIENGLSGGTCTQAFAVWYLCGKALLSGAIQSPASCNSSLIQPPDPTEQEDCLFLDVIVPKSIFSAAGDKKIDGAPVMVWIYGGGFAFGKKGDDGDPAGIIAQSQKEDPTKRGIIYVAFNYRVRLQSRISYPLLTISQGGALGFLSGPDLRVNGSANVGLLDQRLALQWVKENIHRFGGDPNRVTVFGQSAKAGSIIHQITAYAGLRGPVPFQKAILQSPGFQPFPGNWEQDQLFQRFLNLLNVSSIDEARQLPYSIITKVNTEIVAASPYGSFTWAPTVDGTFSSALPGNLLAEGRFDSSVQIMTGFNAQETLYFTDPSSLNNSAFVTSIKASLPDIQPSVSEYISQVLYPEIFNGSNPYHSYFERAELALAENAFTCNTFFLQKAFSKYSASYGYRFSVPTAYHGADVPYTFFNGPNPRVSNDTIATAMQGYFTSFALTGNPNRNGRVGIPEYRAGELILDLNVTGFTVVKDPNANERCVWWQKALYF